MARSLGLKLIFLAASFAALGAVPVGAEHTTLADASWSGLKLTHLILGMMGSGASLFFLPELSTRWLGATVVCGLVCASGGTPALMWAFTAYFKAPFPPPLENVLGISLGVVGVYVIALMHRLGRWLRNNPLGLLTLARGGAVVDTSQLEDKARERGQP